MILLPLLNAVEEGDVTLFLATQEFGVLGAALHLRAENVSTFGEVEKLELADVG